MLADFVKRGWFTYSVGADRAKPDERRLCFS